MAALRETKLGRLFPIPLIRQRWEEADALGPDLHRAVLERERQDPVDTRSNSGGWQSTPDFQEWQEPAAARLLGFLQGLIDRATLELAGPTIMAGKFGWQASGWANVNRRGQYNRLHSHPGCTWSAVYYVDCGDPPPPDRPWAGCISFVNPNGSSIMSFFPEALPQTVDIRPETGLMIVFPSYLGHLVHPYEGDRPRISIAFNFTKDPYP